MQGRQEDERHSKGAPELQGRKHLAKYDPSTNLNVDAQREVKMAAFGILLRCVGGEKTKKLAVNERKKEKKAERAAEEVETDSETTCQVLPTLQPEEKN